MSPRLEARLLRHVFLLVLDGRLVEAEIDGEVYRTAANLIFTNLTIWREEDLVRARSDENHIVALAKKAIDLFNQKRNDLIDKLDNDFDKELAELKISTSEDVRTNSETVGSMVDRMSIMSIRLKKLGEFIQTDKIDTKTYTDYLAVQTRLTNLMASFDWVVGEIYAGNLRHTPERQVKLYNDPHYQKRDNNA